jgi:uncharacterized protein (DUF302 family)
VRGGIVMRTILIAVVLLCVSVPVVSANNGVISVKSSHDVKTTADRLVDALNQKGMTVFARIDHAEGARDAGLELRPTTLIIFGNPKVGTPFMHCGQSVALDLPQKALIWKDADGTVRLSYNDPHYLAQRHGITGCDDEINKIKGALENFSDMATKP